jgi:xenotropic and polytropic retrovirus receptor 1
MVQFFSDLLLFFSFSYHFKGRMIAAPFFTVQFADFWLADQLNSLVTALMDFQFLLWFYVTSDWAGNGSEISRSDLIIRPIVNCLPAWFRFAQCLRRYRDSGI